MKERNRSGSRATPLVVVGLCAMLAACESAPGGADAADLVLTGGRVVTVDDARPEAEAVAMRGDRIVAVGSAAEISGYIGENTEVVDLAGRLVVPGFIESHGHFVSLGQRALILDLTTVTTWDEIVAMVAEAALAAPPGEWITGGGWHQEKWTTVPEPNVDGVPLHAELSRVSPNNPVLLSHASGHAGFANALALEAGGIDRQTPDPAGGTIVRTAAGDPTGLLRETAQGLVSAAMSRDRADRSDAERDAEFRLQVEMAGRDALSKGVTTFHDAGSGFATIDRFRELADEGALPVRLYVMVRGQADEGFAERLADYRTVGYGGNFLTVRAIKHQIDGALGSHGAWLLEPYFDLTSTSGLVLDSVEEIEGTARAALELGYQLNVHAIGDRANRELLDLYEREWTAAGLTGDTLRWRIEHAQHLHPDDVGRFADLHVIAAIQGVHATSDGPWVPDRIGDERARTGAYVWRDLLDAGVTVVNGTDTPVENVDPIPNFHASVTRITSEGTAFYPEQAMTREEALRSYTLDAAYAGFEEGLKGSITPGKLADLVVLSRDILTIPAAEIPSARVDLTILGGEIRYERDVEGG